MPYVFLAILLFFASFVYLCFYASNLRKENKRLSELNYKLQNEFYLYQPTHISEDFAEASELRCADDDLFNEELLNRFNKAINYEAHNLVQCYKKAILANETLELLFCKSKRYDGMKSVKFADKIKHEWEKMFFSLVLDGFVNLEYLYYQRKFTESTGATRYIDFALVSPVGRKVAIEVSGFQYHAQGAISYEEFNDQLFRRNELVIAGWEYLEFSNLQQRDNMHVCRLQLMAALKNDKYLVMQDLVPHKKIKTTLNS